MPISVRAFLHYAATQPCDVLLQIEGAEDSDQHCTSRNLTLPPNVISRQIAGEDGVGTRRWLTVSEDFQCHYEADFEIDRPADQIETLIAAPVSQTPENVTKYLMPSRYCHPEDFLTALVTRFDGLSGGALIAAIRNWLATDFVYDIFASDAATTATQSYSARAGVCRDYAHVLIAMARAAGIPARYVSVYAPDVTPQDFHAVAEVFLNGSWHLVDATGMAHPGDIIRIGVGRDAADVSFMTSYGAMTLRKQVIEVVRTTVPAL